MEVDLASHDGSGTTIPLVVANMTAISGRRMAETIARRGGISVIPQDIPIAIVSDVISWVKSRHIFFDTPITLSPDQTVADAVSLLNKRAHGAIVILDKNKPVGIVTEEDCEGVDRFTQLKIVMSKDLITLPDTYGAKEAFEFLHNNRRKLAPVVSANGELVGILTRVGALRSTLYTPSLDSKGRLRIAAAVGINGDVAAKAKALIDAGEDVLVVETEVLAIVSVVEDVVADIATEVEAVFTVGLGGGSTKSSLVKNKSPISSAIAGSHSSIPAYI